MDKLNEIVEALEGVIDPNDPQASIDNLMEYYEGDDPEAMRAVIELLANATEGK